MILCQYLYIFEESRIVSSGSSCMYKWIIVYNVNVKLTKDKFIQKYSMSVAIQKRETRSAKWTDMFDSNCQCLKYACLN